MTTTKKFKKDIFLQMFKYIKSLNKEHKLIAIRNGKTWYIVSSLKREEINIPLYLKIHFLNYFLFRETNYWRLTNINFVYSPIEIIEAFLLLKKENPNTIMYLEESSFQSNDAKITVNSKFENSLKLPNGMSVIKKDFKLSQIESYNLIYNGITINITYSHVWLSFFEKIFFKNEVY